MSKIVQDLIFGGEESYPPARPVAAYPGGKLNVAPGAGRKAEMVRVAPGVHGWAPADAAEKVAEYVLCRWSKQANGTYLPVPVGGTWAKLTPLLCETLGFAGGLDTIKRLSVAGFLDASQVSPAVTLLDLDSWIRHLNECMDDPDRWAEGSEDLTIYLWKNGLRTEESHEES